MSRAKLKRRPIAAVLCLTALAVLLLPNARSLYEGLLFYVGSLVLPSPAIRAVRNDGRYASLYELVRLTNSERLNYILRRLGRPGLSVEQIPIPASPQSDILVRFSSEGPLTVYSAHYDKLYDDADYQGASDNTAAVTVLLAGIEELARRGEGGPRAFLFTGEEETGLRGAAAFVEYARAKNLAIREILNFDNLGRGQLAIRPSASVPGFVFTLPFYGELAFDGREVRPSPPYSPANVRLVQSLSQAQPDLVVFQRFTATSDSNVFQAQGLDTVALSGDDMYYLAQTWHTYGDRVELLDEKNLDRAFDLILGYPPNTK